MKGFVPTPPATVDLMVERLFQGRPPQPGDTLLDPGCGTGPFIDGVIRWCRQRRIPLPHITGVESDPRHLPVLHEKYGHLPAVHIEHSDFLTDRRPVYNFIVGNPPYVAITALSASEKEAYRSRYVTARGRFDLYLLFFEQALRNLAPDGRLVFITPEKYHYVESAAFLRGLLAQFDVEELRFLREDTFGALVTYPAITVVRNAPRSHTCVIRRDGETLDVLLPIGHEPWLPAIQGAAPESTATTLADICWRISCGVATGADSVFVRPAESLDPALRPYAHPTIAGRQLTPDSPDLARRFVMLVPYAPDGRLLPLNELGAFRRYLTRDEVRTRLLARTCVRHKPWHAFHETPVLDEILLPKIVCKDITETPHFWIDRSGQFIPRHSAYYIVPRNPDAIDIIAGHLNSRVVRSWLALNCQRASKGFLRLQSRVLQRIPLPAELASAADNRTAAARVTRWARQSELALVG